MKNPSNEAEWSAPQTHKIENEAELLDLERYGDIKHTIDTVEYIADELFELRHPELMDDATARAEFATDIAEQGPSFGRWVHYPWSNTLVRVAEPEDHYDLRTARNRNLITNEQQSALHLTRVAAFGLSVGSNVVDRTVQSGIGNEYMLFDHDRLGLTNLNRIQASLAQIGLLKTTVAGRKISELDPYVDQQHYTSGYDRNTDDILRATRPDIIVEEVDNLEVKARLRNIAKELGIPLVMAGDVGYRSTLDVERHDLHEVLDFNGKLSQDDVEKLLAEAALSSDEERGLLIKMLGKENISQDLLMSVMLKGKELAGTPQLGTTAAIGGALTSVAISEIILGRDIESSAHIFDTKQAVGSVGTETFPLGE